MYMSFIIIFFPNRSLPPSIPIWKTSIFISLYYLTVLAGNILPEISTLLENKSS